MLFYHELGRGERRDPIVPPLEASVPPLTLLYETLLYVQCMYMYLYMQDLRQRMQQISGGGAGLRPPVMKAQTLGSSPTRQPDRVITTCTCTCMYNGV